MESREIKHCLSGARAEVPPGQSDAHCCTRIRQNHTDLSACKARRRLPPTAPIIFFSAFLYSSTLCPYPRRGSGPKAKEQSKRGSLAQRRAQSSPAHRALPRWGIQRCLCRDSPATGHSSLTQLRQDCLEPASETCLGI